MRSRLSLLVLLAALVPAAALAHRPAPQPVELQLVDRHSGQPLPGTLHRGQHWVAGAPGQRYAVRLTNHSAGRVLVVLSVDGVNAVSGETASPHQTGYVLAPGQSTDISGWRKSHQEVAAFHFTDLDDSYAARTGRPDDIGVVGIAVFHERRLQPLPRPLPPVLRDRAAAPSAAGRVGAFESAPAEAPQAIGTGHGEREYSPVSSTAFVRASTQPASVVTVRYDSPRNLLARGIRVHPRPTAWQPPREPRAFPGGFVPDPR